MVAEQDVEGVRFAGLRWFLRAVVFMAGGVIMSVEITGIRIVSRNLSSSNYVIGSVIGVFMGALAIGYYIGGRLADWRQSLPLLGVVLILGGGFTLAIPALEDGLGPAFQRLDTSPIRVMPASLAPMPEFPADEMAAGSGWDIRLTSVTMSFALFFFPSLFLGMTAPFVSRLEIRDVGRSGSAIGGTFAVSTVGSIGGTFLTSFYLMETVGVFNTIAGCGVFALVLGALSIALGRRT